MRLKKTTRQEKTKVTAMITGVSLARIASISSDPMPGTRKICSVTSAPPNTAGICRATSVTTGISALRVMCRIVTLRSPLYVRGSFKDPQAGVKAGPLIARGAVAAALATLVTPAAALLALISPSEGQENQCRNILAQMKK